MLISQMESQRIFNCLPFINLSRDYIVTLPFMILTC
jgi:hypothetical protein